MKLTSKPAQGDGTPGSKKLLCIVYDLNRVMAVRMHLLRQALPGSIEMRLLPVVWHADEAACKVDLIKGSREPVHFGVNPKKQGCTAEAFVYNNRMGSVLWHAAHADLVLSMGVLGGATLAGAAACRLLRKPHIICCQCLPEHAEAGRHPLIRSLKQFCLNGAHRVVSQSAASDITLQRIYGVPDERIHRTSYSAGMDEFGQWKMAAERTGRTECRRKFGFLPEQVVMTYAGNYLPFKGIPDILKAIAGQDPRSQTVCVFAGHEEPRHKVGGTINYFRTLADELGVTSRCRFLREMPRRDLAELYLASDVVMLPSHRDTFGKTIAEAASLGKPAIVTENCGCAGTLVVDGVSGFVIPAGNVNAMREAMLRLESAELRGRMGAEAVAIVRSVCDPAKELNVLSGLIAEVLQ